LWLYCVSKKLGDRNENKKFKNLKRTPVKSIWKLRLIRSKQIEYTKKIIKEVLIRSVWRQRISVTE